MRLFASLFLVTLILAGCAPAEYCATFDDPDMQALCTATGDSRSPLQAFPGKTGDPVPLRELQRPGRGL